MLLTLVLGAIGALLVFPKLSIWEAGILAAVLAPTDAGLGQIIVSSTRVPMNIREALNVEAGLNDGLSVPFLLFFIALAGGGGWLLAMAQRRKWMAPAWTQLGVVTLPLLCLLASEGVGASMFIAAFVAGLAVQAGFKDAAQHSVEFTEEWGQLFNLSVFFLFGLLVARAAPSFNARHAVYAVLSLTIVRMLPVAVALIGTRLSRATVLFMGWFGPRGLASIVLGLVYLEQRTHQSAESTIPLAVMTTVWLSIFAHGLSARPGIRLYAKTIAGLPADAPEIMPDTK
jgi:sodium/hydrogen antiporter